jgi:outer membrane protein assembly factor BamB
MRRDGEPCTACGAARPHAARFCGRCGAALPTPRARPRARRRVTPAGPMPGAEGGRRTRRAVVAGVVVAVAGAGLLTGPAGPHAGPVGGPDDAPGAVATTTPDGAVAVPRPERLPGARGDVARDPETAGDAGPGRACSGRAGPVACVRWTADLGVAAPRSVVHRGSSVLVAEQDGRVRGLAAADGTPRWRFDAGAPVRFHGTVASTVPISAGSTTSFVDPTTGRTVGSFAGRVGAAAPVSPWLVVTHAGSLEARSVTGSASWSLSVPDDALAWLTTNGPYLSSWRSLRSDRLVRLSVNTGSPRWEHDIAGRVAAVHALGSSTLVAVEDTGDGAGVLILDRRGTVLFDEPVTGRVAHVTPSAEGVAAVVTEGPGGAVLHVFDAERGTHLGPVDLGASSRGSLPPVIGAGLVAAATSDPEPVITVIGRGDGLVRLRLEVAAPLRGLALPGDATIVTVSGSEVSAWSLGTGVRRWWLELGDPGSVVASLPLLVRSDRTLVALDADPQRRRHERAGVSDAARATDAIGQRRGRTS